MPFFLENMPSQYRTFSYDFRLSRYVCGMYVMCLIWRCRIIQSSLSNNTITFFVIILDDILHHYMRTRLSRLVIGCSSTLFVCAVFDTHRPLFFLFWMISVIHIGEEGPKHHSPHRQPSQLTHITSGLSSSPLYSP